MKIARGAWTEYKHLYRLSQIARYYGISEDIEEFETLMELNYIKCKQHLDNFKKYIKNQGIEI
jgi:hypothetical protein